MVTDMDNIRSLKTVTALAGFLALALQPGGADAKQVQTTGGTPITLPDDLCKYTRYSDQAVTDLRNRRDFNELLAYTVEFCPQVALMLTDMPTAAIATPATAPDNDGGSGTGGGSTGGGSTGGGDTGGGASGSGGDTGGDGGAGGGSGGGASGSGGDTGGGGGAGGGSGGGAGGSGGAGGGSGGGTSG